jgi:YihY family inner membrane protein
VVDIVMTTFKRFSEDDGATHAAALTYYIFFSIFPLLLFAVSVLGFVARGNEQLRRDLLDAGVNAVPLLAGMIKGAGLDFLERRAGSLALSAVVLSFYTGSGAVVALEHSLNRLDHIAEEGTWLQKRLRSLRWLALLGPAALLTAAFGGVANFSDQTFGEDSAPARLFFLIGLVGGLMVSTALFAAAFRFLSKAHRPWRHVLPGAVAGAVAFELLKAVGSVYLATGAKSREATFGAFAAAAAFLIAAFLIARITLLAAELNTVLADRRLARRPSPIRPNQTGGQQ